MAGRLKLFLVVRRDLPPGLQVAQLCHAMRAFADEHGEVERQWFERSNTLVCLSVRDREALEALAREARSWGIEASLFCEPDLDGALTALAIGPRGKRLCRKLRLAFGSVES